MSDQARMVLKKEQRRSIIGRKRSAADDVRDIAEDGDDGDGFEIEIKKTGKNSWRIGAKVSVQASLQPVWDVLTDYERLADFIPGLAVSQLLEKRDKFARVFQIGEQKLAFGLKFNVKATIDCFETDIQMLPFGQKRDIEFKMVEGDFQLFEGKWSVVKQENAGNSRSEDRLVGQEFLPTLVYVVDVKPKMWFPVHLVKGRLCKEIRANLFCLREEAEKAFQNAQSALQQIGTSVVGLDSQVGNALSSFLMVQFLAVGATDEQRANGSFFIE